MTQVGYIGSPDREEFRRLAIRLEERRAEILLLDPSQGPEIEIGPDLERACGHDLSKLRGIYVADLGLPSSVVRNADGSLDPQGSAAALAASRRQLAAWNALLEQLKRHTNVINPPSTHDLHALKPWEMQVARDKQWPAPRTVATTDPAALFEATSAVDSSWIQKGMVGGYGYTTVFPAPGDLGAATQLIAEKPIMVQERVEGDNVRAFVVGSSVVGAARIIPSDGAEVDSRRETGRVSRIKLTEEAERICLEAARHWGILFCGVDFIIDAASREYKLLECNSAPFFVSYERQSGIDVTSALADLLLGKR